MRIIYTFFIFIYYTLIRFVSPFHSKAGMWIAGRKNLFQKLAATIQPEDEIIWFHAASLGEFEQGRPVIEALRDKYPKYKILLTFFSPSGYEVRKDYKGADYIFYLPADIPVNAQKFVELCKPKLAVFIKYEYWFNFLHVLYKRQVPVFFISAIFRKNQHFFKSYGAWSRKMLKKAAFFFVQDQNSFKLLKSIGLTQVLISGDTRFDRVYEIAQKSRSFPMIEKFVVGHKTLLAGSTWPADEVLIEHLLRQNQQLRLILAPHEIHESRIKSLVSRFGEEETLIYSKAEEDQFEQRKILIIDGIGFLSSLYRYCDIAYIGGGFGKGIHNILEAVTFGKPPIFGPNYTKFREAVELVQSKGAFTISGKEELNTIVQTLISDEEAYRASSEICRDYILTKKGATEKILKKLTEYL